jgi:hypothetical protein
MARNVCARYARLGAILVVSSLGSSGTGADEVRPARYGVIEAAHPGPVSGGLFGLGTEAGMAYTIRLLEASDPVVVSTRSAAFLIGDCVAGQSRADTLDTDAMGDADRGRAAEDPMQ